ncbi:MAG: type IV pilus assembly protein PilC [Planctomycetota bacterium]|jgi:type IV pilus assembly protein PilC
MLFTYKVINEKGETKVGEIEASTNDLAVGSLQRRGYVVVSVVEAKEGGFWHGKLSFGGKVKLKDVVMMSRQLSTLFEAQVSAVKTFSLMGTNVENKILGQTLQTLTQDIQGGITISEAMRKHPAVFGDFYVNMVAAGEETGRLKDTFLFLADYLERQYTLTSKTKNALIYPAFVISTFIIVMVLVMTVIIPKLASIILESGQEVPTFTKIIIWMSDFLINYGIFLLIAILVGFAFIGISLRSKKNKHRIDDIKLKLPFFGKLYKQLYLSRIADNMRTMLMAGIPVVRTLEITSSIIENKIYKDILSNSVESVKAGNMISDSFAAYPEMPDILVQMVKVGEETGSLAKILETLGKFYEREVNSTVDALIGLIEPAMIVSLGLAVGILLSAVMLPIYNIAGGIT